MDAMRRGLGRIADDAFARPGDRAASMPALTLVRPAAPATPVRFPVGVQSRKVDDSRRIRLRWDSDSIAELLGWSTGLLDAVCHDGWLVLTQRPEHVGAPAGRNSSFANLVSAGTDSERIAFRDAHLGHLAAACGDHLLVAPIPDAGALVVTNPVGLAAFASSHVQTLITNTTNPTTEETAS
jgi:hypothetical protein